MEPDLQKLMLVLDALTQYDEVRQRLSQLAAAQCEAESASSSQPAFSARELADIASSQTSTRRYVRQFMTVSRESVEAFIAASTAHSEDASRTVQEHLGAAYVSALRARASPQAGGGGGGAFTPVLSGAPGGVPAVATGRAGSGTPGEVPLGGAEKPPSVRRPPVPTPPNVMPKVELVKAITAHCNANGPPLRAAEQLTKAALASALQAHLVGVRKNSMYILSKDVLVSMYEEFGLGSAHPRPATDVEVQAVQRKVSNCVAGYERAAPAPKMALLTLIFLPTYVLRALYKELRVGTDDPRTVLQVDVDFINAMVRAATSKAEPPPPRHGVDGEAFEELRLALVQDASNHPSQAAAPLPDHASSGAGLAVDTSAAPSTEQADGDRAGSVGEDSNGKVTRVAGTPALRISDLSHGKLSKLLRSHCGLRRPLCLRTLRREQLISLCAEFGLGTGAVRPATQSDVEHINEAVRTANRLSSSAFNKHRKAHEEAWSVFPSSSTWHAETSTEDDEEAEEADLGALALALVGPHTGAASGGQTAQHHSPYIGASSGPALALLSLHAESVDGQAVGSTAVPPDAPEPSPPVLAELSKETLIDMLHAHCSPRRVLNINSLRKTQVLSMCIELGLDSVSPAVVTQDAVDRINEVVREDSRRAKGRLNSGLVTEQPDQPSSVSANTSGRLESMTSAGGEEGGGEAGDARWALRSRRVPGGGGESSRPSARTLATSRDSDTSLLSSSSTPLPRPPSRKRVRDASAAGEEGGGEGGALRSLPRPRTSVEQSAAVEAGKSTEEGAMDEEGGAGGSAGAQPDKQQGRTPKDVEAEDEEMVVLSFIELVATLSDHFSGQLQGWDRLAASTLLAVYEEYELGTSSPRPVGLADVEGINTLIRSIAVRQGRPKSTEALRPDAKCALLMQMLRAHFQGGGGGGGGGGAGVGWGGPVV